MSVGIEKNVLTIDEAVEKLESLIGYQFKERKLPLEAITHSSFNNESLKMGQSRSLTEASDNERLEFLGDAVLGLSIAQLLMNRYREASEGQLSKWRSVLVSQKTLSEISLSCALGDCLLLGKGERLTGGALKGSILASALEAVVGALYLEAGFERTSQFIEKIYASMLEGFSDSSQPCRSEKHDKKTVLQERTQFHYRATPIYRLIKSWGPEHEKVFLVEIIVEGHSISVGQGRSKKDAEQNAASEALNIFESLKYSREGLNNLAFNNKKDQPEKIEYIDGTESC
jgi:ribonuclease-3